MPIYLGQLGALEQRQRKITQIKHAMKYSHFVAHGLLKNFDNARILGFL
jgi:hypothetical protein